MTRFFAISLVAVTLSACNDAPPSALLSAPSDAHRIVNGTPTGNLYPSVGGLLFDRKKDGLTGDDLWCTGSLISPTVFLTAAHCVVGFYTPKGTEFYVSFASDLYANNAKYIKATGYVADPLYGHDPANLHDLAVVFIPSHATRGMTLYSLPTLNELDTRSANGGLNDAIFINVGYGSSASKKGIPSFTYDGLRKWSESEFMNLQPDWLGLLQNSSATGLGGDCYGDSGGPKFLKSNPGVVYATVTTGDYNCRATSLDYRTDTKAARDFLGTYVSLP